MTAAAGPLAALIDTRRVYDGVFSVYVTVGLGVFALFTLTILGLTVIYRRRPGRAPSRRHEANVVEVTYAVVLLLTAVALLDVTFTAEHKEDTVANRERPALTVAVTASRWEWSFFYSGHGITHLAGQSGQQPLVVPADEPVRFLLRSADVIHGFYVPQLAFKRDTMPGITEQVTLDFDRTGRFSGECSEYCGQGHPDMVFPVRVLTPASFRAWLAANERRAAT